MRAARDRVSVETKEPKAAPETEQAIGLFLMRWIELERLIRQIVLERTGEHRPVLPTSQTLQRLEISNARTRSNIEALRRLRNYLVHGIEIPDTAIIVESAERLEPILEELRRTLRKQ